MERDWINLSEAASLLGVHPATVRTWADRGELPSKRTAGGHRRFRRSDIEARSDVGQKGRLAGAQFVIQSVLGRTRFRLTEGALADEGWYGRLDEEAKEEHRAIGRELLVLFETFLSYEEPRDEVLVEARRIGRRYERMGRRAGLSLVETTRAYLLFRRLLSQTVYDMMAATQGVMDTTLIHHRVAVLSDEILLAIIEAYERETSDE